MVTPWGSHLGSEEYEPDAKKGAESAKTMAPFFGGGDTLGGDVAKPKPYYYGYPVEVAVTSAAGDHVVSKHYSMGRFAHELSYVMPDRKTVYQSDDGTSVGFFMYIADNAGSLSAGTLYAAKWHQTSPAGESALGEADIEWLELGHASDAEISKLIDAGIGFSDIFTAADPAADGSCGDGMRSINANGIGEECLALVPGQELAAAFLETRRYAAYLGATTELRKEEGITFDAVSGRLFVAYSEVQYGMEDRKKNGAASDKYDVGTSNDVKLRFNTCGAVYAYDVGSVRGIQSRYVVTHTRGLLAGRMTTAVDPDKLDPATIDAYSADSPFAGNTCDINGIANPDNLTFVPGQNLLLIGEDSTDGHENDAVWAYDLDSGTLARLMTTPYGAETTSLYYYPNIGGYAYIMTVAQHPYGESDQDKLQTPGDKHSYMGVLGPLPAQRER
jgi:secreted PhoX family phosphatase